MKSLTSDQKLQLVRFICSFAWADLEVSPEERAFVAEAVRRLDFQPEEARQVEAWLALPPRPEEIDPQDVPHEHRRLFLEHARGLIRADGVVNQREGTQYRLFRDLTR
jgi:hypothetical protein